MQHQNLSQFHSRSLISIHHLHNHNRLLSLTPFYSFHRKFCSSSPKQPVDGEQLSQSSASTATTPSATQLTREHLQRAFKKWQRLFTIKFLIAIAIVGGTFAYCWDHPNQIINLKNRISQIFSELGTETLNQKELQQQATEYSKQMIKDVFRDESMQKETKQFLIQILSQEDFLNTVSVLLQDLFARDVMIESVQRLVIDVFNDQQVIDQCKKLVGHAISAEENKQLLLKVLNEILDDKELTDHARDVANDTIKNVLNDEDIKTLSAVFLQHVLNDDSVQQTSSDSLYRIFVGALTPSVFKRKKKKDGEEETSKHVPHQHFEIDGVEGQETQQLQSGELQSEDEVDEVQNQVNHIDSVVGNHN